MKTKLKPFLSIDEQIIRIYSRGMKINGKPINREFLLRKNYYNTINVYGKFFFKENKVNEYFFGSNFEDVKTLYHFDKNLRDLSLKKLLEVESNLKSTVAYIYSKKFRQVDDYRKITSYNITDSYGKTNRRKKKDFSYLQRQFDKIINKNYKQGRKRINSVHHYMDRRGYVPF